LGCRLSSRMKRTAFPAIEICAPPGGFGRTELAHARCFLWRHALTSRAGVDPAPLNFRITCPTSQDHGSGHRERAVGVRDAPHDETAPPLRHLRKTQLGAGSCPEEVPDPQRLLQTGRFHPTPDPAVFKVRTGAQFRSGLGAPAPAHCWPFMAFNRSRSTWSQDLLPGVLPGRWPGVRQPAGPEFGIDRSPPMRPLPLILERSNRMPSITSILHC